MSITDYLKGTKGELKHVSWPTKNQAINYTVIVVGVAIFMAAFLGLFDFIFTLVLEQLI
jgi:preprotein translocase SecE subunit